LFRIDVDDAWRDLRTADGDAKSVILKLTDTSNLEDARDKFLHDPKTRAKVILSNADSVALLVTLLGRERF
jgi:predicted GTPase